MPGGLQWRAGWLPGQTGVADALGDLHHRASMEGRVVARPNVIVGCVAPDDLEASMEGRVVARPNRERLNATFDAGRASMEGRVVARPNRRSRCLG